MVYYARRRSPAVATQDAQKYTPPPSECPRDRARSRFNTQASSPADITILVGGCEIDKLNAIAMAAPIQRTNGNHDRAAISGWTKTSGYM